ncbi:alpha-glucuronidase family glycosyl hydrolase [Lachnotalea glycerini]|uniref:Xylan alpha-1,2-glucuronidase n=1 Tax=Lachnotalea glycerini TaxID=1763509 RepID=A0A371JHI6_9FIRM|nr:alpha-glucuronidase family glycosyl hydrolase [Lachnotalea glycerini]RDY32190.1 alpha-glucuronidase [Lachnotalea glycerini]
MSWEQAWLAYHCVVNYEDASYFEAIYTLESGKIIDNALEELRLATNKMFGKSIAIERSMPQKGICLMLIEEISLNEAGYKIERKNNLIFLSANTQKGLLYAVFALLRLAACKVSLSDVHLVSVPDKEFRMLNHWDNMDGSIERGYSGNSFFFKDQKIEVNERTKDYARLLASIGINATVINNVNVRAEATDFITEPYLKQLRVLSDLFESYGVKLFLSLNYAACIDIGGITTADPLDKTVISWWEERMELVYQHIPTLGGFLVKADSEGRPGPFTYKRNQADGANMLARAIAPYQGIIIWRCFVYNCQQDWRDKKIDRARAAYDYFYDLDGEFLENVILQIKNGPIDFQVREPFMPLFGKLKKTNHMMEVQIAQEYTGQQIDLCYLIPWFKELLTSRTYCGEDKDTIADLLEGKCCNHKGRGIVAVANTGNDENWTGHDLAAANFYGFGRMAWDSKLSPEEIVKEWISQTFSDKREVVMVLTKLLMMSWPVYEKYTAPLGVGFMVTPSNHYGPNIDGYEYSKWGTYHRADHFGIGVDRSLKGTGYASLYNPPLAMQYEYADTCPDELLLFFHHVDYNHILHNGKTVLQHIYDTHFEGAKKVEEMLSMWEQLKESISPEKYERTLIRFQQQRNNAKEWCDQINSYFYRKSGIADQHQRPIY